MKRYLQQPSTLQHGYITVTGIYITAPPIVNKSGYICYISDINSVDDCVDAAAATARC